MKSLASSVVLIVEDEPIVGFALEDILSSAGAKSYLADSVAGAEVVLGQTSIDVAVLDINLYGESSFPLAERLVEAGTPFIFATGYGDILSNDRFSQIQTVTKPYTEAEIRRALSALGFY